MNKRVIVVPAGGLDEDKQPCVREVETLDLETMQSMVGGPIELVRIDEGVDLYCNENGRLVGLPMNREVRTDDGRRYDFLGDFFIVGGDDETGENVGLTDEQIAKWLPRMKDAPVCIMQAT
jgi:hypothetical protein